MTLHDAPHPQSDVHPPSISERGGSAVERTRNRESLGSNPLSKLVHFRYLQDTPVHSAVYVLVPGFRKCGGGCD